MERREVGLVARVDDCFKSLMGRADGEGTTFTGQGLFVPHRALRDVARIQVALAARYQGALNCP